ncbi:MAG: hypothetical protein KGD73_01615 [Candidatus Lokiarchaeota archaeon]|nr:hypothetical protein [Candidatus Lokiarchaeota archaeon]
MIKELQKLFKTITLTDIDSLKDIMNNHIYLEFASLYPNLKDILVFGNERDPQEFNRTVKHIFRTIKVFLLIQEGKFDYSGFSPNSINQILAKIKKISDFNMDLIPIILVYHDIGKFIRKRDHPQQSFKLIYEKGLLNPFKLNKKIQVLIKKVIQYHVLFATIYTGESTYYGTYSLIHDTELVNLMLESQYLNLFIDCLEVFTYIDILGYSYSQIFDHYIKYYEEINLNLKEILSLLPSIESALERALFYSHSWIEWRIAGALRIFQFVSTQPYLTPEFYFDKLKLSMNSIPNDVLVDKNWENLVRNDLKHSNRIQIKYGLAFLMILAFGSFHRASINENVEISPNLLSFWILITEEIIKRSKEDTKAPWNVYILGVKNWFSIPTKTLKKINLSYIRSILNDANSEYDNNINEYTLNLDLSKIEEKDIN